MTDATELRTKLEQLEQPPPGCDMIDVELLLRDVGYERHDDGDVVLYANDDWNSLFTFRQGQTTVSQARLEYIIRHVRWHLEQRGLI